MSGTPRRLAQHPSSVQHDASYQPPAPDQDAASRSGLSHAPVLVIAGERVEVWDEPVSAAIRALELMHACGDLAALQLPEAPLMREAMRRTLAIVPRERWRNLEAEAPYLLPAPIDEFPPV
jgi:hypothetical protein